ncbi:MAG: NAD(+) synthase [Oscillospiraceae bacterium]|nr:NAD(+) synthase [Oscillospiraceae bacterium]
MKHGFLKVMASSVNIKVADCEHNKERIIEKIFEADERGAELLVLPELCITGATCGDLFYQSALLKAAENALTDIIERTKAAEVITVLGLPVSVDNSLLNCSAVISKGELWGLVPKIGDDLFLEPKEHRVIWYKENYVVPVDTKLVFKSEKHSDFSFTVNSAQGLIAVYPKAEPEYVGRADSRRIMAKAVSGIQNCAYIYANAGYGESTTDMVYSGHCIIAENGTILAEARPFDGEDAVCEIDLERLIHDRRKSKKDNSGFNGWEMPELHVDNQKGTFERHIPMLPFIPECENERKSVCRDILMMQASGLKKRIEHTNCKTCVVGISGGLDSALALMVTVKALDMLGRPRTDILAVTMPCFGTTSRTKSNAQLLCEALGVSFSEVNITDAVLQHFKDIGHDKDTLDVTFENSQARERTQVLMDIANKNGGLVIGTGDLSELALGWATYNGDHMSMYGVNSSVPKTLVRHLTAYCAETAENEGVANSLRDILDTPVSPELLPAENGEISQKTEDLVGPYELHDFFLYYMIRFGFTPSKIFYMAKHAFRGAYDDETIKHWLKTFIRRFFAQQFKRSCVPDGVKVGSVTLSPRGDWKMPSDASARVWLEEAENL